MFEYCFNNNDEYEDEWESSLFSFEKIPFDEFVNIVHKAYKLCEEEDDYYKENVTYNKVMDKILEIDKRFFIPERMATAYIGIEKGDYDHKIRYIHNHKERRFSR